MMYNIFLLAAFGITLSYADTCLPDVCAQMVCTTPVCGEGEKYMENAGACRCCDVCAKIRNRNETCELPLYTQPIESTCDDGLFCVITHHFRLRCLSLADMSIDLNLDQLTSSEASNLSLLED